MKASILAIVLSAALFSCSTPDPEVLRYQKLDYDSKSVFLTYYPYLTRDQKEELLSGNTDDPKELIQDWAGEFNDPNHEVGSFEQMMINARNRKIESLEIQTSANEPVVIGDRLRARAYVTYANGKRVDVTEDTDWRVEPELGEMVGNVLKYGCVDSDLTISANFLQEKATSKTIAFRKPLDSLEITVSDAAIAEDGSYHFQLGLLAHCKDGSTSDVSCEANWGPGITNCGSWIISRKNKNSELGDPIVATARYGNLSIQKTLQPPLR